MRNATDYSPQKEKEILALNIPYVNICICTYV